MKKLLLIPFLMLAFGCKNYDDFAFSGVVVDYEMCQSMFNMGYAVMLTSPDTIGGTYITQEGKTYENVVVIYGSDRLLHPNDSISGRIYLDPLFSKTECNYHYDRDVPEAVFTELKKL